MERTHVDQIGSNPSPNHQPVLDPDTVAELRALLLEEEPKAFRDLIDVFLTDTERRLASLREAVHNLEWSAIALTAHAMKGSCATFGALPLARLCAQIEAAARSMIGAATSQLLPQVEAEYGRVRAALMRELSLS